MDKKTVRFSIAFSDEDVFAETTARERCHYMAQAVWAISLAVVRQKVTMSVLACDLRPETADEMEARMSKNGAKQLSFWATELLSAKRQAETPFDLAWLQEHFPDRWRVEP